MSRREAAAPAPAVPGRDAATQPAAAAARDGSGGEALGPLAVWMMAAAMPPHVAVPASVTPMVNSVMVPTVAGADVMMPDAVMVPEAMVMVMAEAVVAMVMAPARFGVGRPKQRHDGQENGPNPVPPHAVSAPLISFDQRC